jgi:DNA-directed RNA polymerase subunit M/transcription elongation factor TFIIS
MIRARALAAFSRHLDAGDASDLEHACFCASALNGAPYSRFVYRELYALEQQSALAAVVHERGAIAALALPDASLYERCSAREQVSASEARRAECVRVLADLSADGPGADLPEKGIKCARCGSTDISFEFSQTRSADEGTTVFCYCTACSKRWKM